MHELSTGLAPFTTTLYPAKPTMMIHNRPQMPCEKHFERQCGRLHLRLDLYAQGADWLALLRGGAPHIGATALGLPPVERHAAAAFPAPLGRPGHREAALAQQVAYRLAEAGESAVCCCAGIHYEAITAEEIALVLCLAEELIEEAARQLRHDRLARP